VEDVGALVEPRGHGPGVLEGIDRPLHFVPALVDRLVEAGGPSALAAAALAVRPLVLRLGDGVLDLPSPQVAAVTPGGIGLVAAKAVRSGAGASAAEPADTDAFHDGDELRGVAPLARSNQQGQRAASAFPCEVNLAGETAPRASESLIGAVLPGRASFPGTRGDLLRAPAACWWARQVVESTLTIDQSMRPSASASARTAA